MNENKAVDSDSNPQHCSIPDVDKWLAAFDADAEPADVEETLKEVVWTYAIYQPPAGDPDLAAEPSEDLEGNVGAGPVL